MTKELNGQGRDSDLRIHGWESESPGPSEIVDKVVYVDIHSPFFREKIHGSDQILRGIQTEKSVVREGWFRSTEGGSDMRTYC